MSTEFSSIPLVREVNPTEEEFANFPKYIETLEQDKSMITHGAIKVTFIFSIDFA